MSDTSNTSNDEPTFTNPTDARRENDEEFAEYVRGHGGNPPADPNDNGPDEYDE